MPAQSARRARRRAGAGAALACRPVDAARASRHGPGLVAVLMELLDDVRPEPGGIGILSAPRAEPGRAGGRAGGGSCHGSFWRH
jgi:hypothetical protein